MKSRNIIWTLLVALSVGCGGEEVIPNLGYILRVSAPIGTKLEFYDSEEDFWSRSNAAFTAITDEQFQEDNNGDSTILDTLYVHVDRQPYNYWIYASNGKYNNLRNGNSFSGNDIDRNWPDKFQMPPFIDGVNSSTSGTYREFSGMRCYTSLTQTPTRLQLQVLNAAMGAEGAEVQLYFSEEAYLNDLVAHQDTDQLLDSYSLNYESFASEEYFNQTTDSEGYVLFDDLEPKQYWFRITKDDMTNDSGTINLSEALPDDMNITTSITVGIN